MEKKKRNFLSSSPFWIRLLHWEYWPFHLVYLPIYPYFIWLGIKSRSFFFFSASNPGIENGGFLMESKAGIDKVLPVKYKPVTLYFEPGFNNAALAAALVEHQLAFPLIIKPDIGSKGKGVQKVNNKDELEKAAKAFPVPFILQPFIDLPKEIGLFYVRHPQEQQGTVTGIVRKKFLQVTGDGKSTLLELLQQNERYILQLPALKKLLGAQLTKLLPAGTTEIVVPFGNHARGCLFIDDSHLVNDQLNKLFDGICKEIDGFYYGRLDIRYNTWEELLEGKNFSIIELNGAGSEPTHIYDPKHSLFFGWKEIIRHLKLLYRISRYNHREGRVAYMDFRSGLKMFRDNSALEKLEF